MVASLVPPEFEEELEVLQAIYGEEAVRAAGGPQGTALRLLVDLRPRVEQGAALVSVCVAVDLPVGYPAAAVPRVSVERSRGLSDAGIKVLLTAAERAAGEHGCQDFGCISHVLADVCEALDETNDACECNICLALCGKDEAAVHTSCEHVFHATCIGRWATMKAQEAEAAAVEATSSLRAEREALQREVAEGEHREAELIARAEDARTRLAECTRIASAAQARAQRRADEEEDDEPLLELEAACEEEEAEEILTPEEQLRRFQERAREARAESQRVRAEERHTKGRLAEQRRLLTVLEEELAGRAARRHAAALPCPVCREPIERSLLPVAPVLEAMSSGSSASVEALPDALRKQVREVQKRQSAILASRRQHALVAEEEESEPGPSEAGAGPGPVPSGAGAVTTQGGAMSSSAPTRTQANGEAPERLTGPARGSRREAAGSPCVAEVHSKTRPPAQGSGERSAAGVARNRRPPDEKGGRQRQQRGGAAVTAASREQAGWESGEWSSEVAWWKQGSWEADASAWTWHSRDAGADRAQSSWVGDQGSGATTEGSGREPVGRWRNRRQRWEGSS
mmetsp:Transcript_537/g.1651  ORF Transcript_537/g.1651 Transcript_537/m.1651 type:complete len:572 (+) Transcript_537:94-1809(+)